MAQVYKGYNGAGNQAARIAGQSAEMDVVAEALARRAREIAIAHSVTGNFFNSIDTAEIRGKRGVTDRIVYTDDPAAVSIEFGHQTRLGKGIHGPRSYVEGLHIFGRVAGTR
jgi:hypothetical protein